MVFSGFVYNVAVSLFWCFGVLWFSNAHVILMFFEEH